MIEYANNLPTLNSTFQRTGVLFVLSAPSGGGKTTLCAGLRANQDFVYSVSCTTRAPRPGERDGEHYHFLSQEEFTRRVEAEEFLEYAEVHGRYYGTLKSTVIENLRKGVDVLIDVDIAGAASIRGCGDKLIADSLADVFVMPPSVEELRQRLERRGTEAPEQIALRVRNAVAEMERWHEYKYTIISRTPPEDVESFRAIMRAERQLTRRYVNTP